MTLPKLVRIKRYSAGKYVGYWSLRAVGEANGWMLTKVYNKAGRDEQVQEVGSGYDVGASVMLQLMRKERAEIVEAFEFNELGLKEDVRGEAEGRLMSRPGFRPGWAQRRLTQHLRAKAENAKRWERDLEGVRRMLAEYGWLPS